MTPTARLLVAKLDRIESKVDSLESKVDSLQGDVASVHVDVASIRTEVRIVGTEQRAHEVRDVERFEGVRDRADRFEAVIESDIRELKSRVIGVEDTSRTHIVTAAQADALTARAQLEKRSRWAHDWRKISVNALITIAIAVVSVIATLVAKGT